MMRKGHALGMVLTLVTNHIPEIEEQTHAQKWCDEPLEQAPHVGIRHRPLFIIVDDIR